MAVRGRVEQRPAVKRSNGTGLKLRRRFDNREARRPPRCEGCPYLKGRTCGPDGPEDSDLVIIGEAPGRDELAAGHPFVGKSGQLLNTVLERSGIDRRKAYVLNAMLCQPPTDPKTKQSGYRKGIEACRERLTEEVLAHPRKLILTMGNSANRGLLGDFNFKITGKRGQPIDLEEIGLVFPTFHPASVLRNQGEWPRWFGDIKYAASLYLEGKSALKKPPKPTAWVMLLDKEEEVYYPRTDEWRAWDESIVDGSQLDDWPIRRVVTGLPAAIRAIDLLLEKPELSGDIETGYSYSPRVGEIIAFAVSWSETEGVVFSEGLLNSKPFRKHLERLLNDPRPLWIGHNWKYDSSYLRWQIMGGAAPEVGPLALPRIGTTERYWHDTMLEHYCLDETKGTHALEDVSRDLLGASDYKYIVRKYAQKANKAKGIEADVGYENVPREVLYPYCLLDTCHTFSVHQILCPKVHKSPGLTKLYEDLLLPASGFLQKVQDYGLWVNQDFIKELDVDLGAKVIEANERLAAEVEDLWDTEEFMASRWATKKRPEVYLAQNWRHTSFILEKLIGWVPMNTNERTLRDLDQTGKDQSATFGYKAKNYARGHPNRKVKLNYPYIQALIDVRLGKHAYGMLVKNIWKYIEPDGRIHTTFNLQATETGRLSSTAPNLQNLPVPEKDDPKPARNIVGAPPGKVLIEADYSQLELRILAHFSDDDNLLNVYLEGRDLHTELSIAIWGPGFTNYQRVRAKAVNFGIAYGRGAGSIAAEHDIPEAEAEEMRQAWFDHFPKAAAWLQELHAAPFSGKGRTIVTPFGRRRRFGVISKENHSDLKNQSANFPMQSNGTDLTLLSAMRIQDKWDREGTNAHIVCLVHDALVAECPEEIKDKVSDELAEMMRDTPKRILVPKIDFPVDIHIGREWGSMKTEELSVTKKVVGTDNVFGKAVSEKSQERARRLT